MGDPAIWHQKIQVRFQCANFSLEHFFFMITIVELKVYLIHSSGCLQWFPPVIKAELDYMPVQKARSNHGQIYKEMMLLLHEKQTVMVVPIDAIRSFQLDDSPGTFADELV
jgi:hypothetical protein